jgi:hypothetical protein
MLTVSLVTSSRLCCLGQTKYGDLDSSRHWRNRSRISRVWGRLPCPQHFLNLLLLNCVHLHTQPHLVTLPYLGICVQMCFLLPTAKFKASFSNQVLLWLSAWEIMCGAVTHSGRGWCPCFLESGSGNHMNCNNFKMLKKERKRVFCQKRAEIFLSRLGY